MVEEYPVCISEEDNRRMKYPFLKACDYDKSICCDGSMILIRKSGECISDEILNEIERINRVIAARTAFKEDGKFE
jgi:hypothetical protein